MSEFNPNIACVPAIDEELKLDSDELVTSSLLQEYYALSNLLDETPDDVEASLRLWVVMYDLGIYSPSAP